MRMSHVRIHRAAVATTVALALLVLPAAAAFPDAGSTGPPVPSAPAPADAAKRLPTIDVRSPYLPDWVPRGMPRYFVEAEVAPGESDGSPVSVGIGSDAAADGPDAGDPRTAVPISPGEAAGISVVGAAGLLVGLRAFLESALAGSGLALYHRIRGSEVLECLGRRRVFEAIRDSPGIALKELVAETHFCTGTVKYHVEHLERGRLVLRRRDGRARRHFVVGATEEEQHAIGVLRQELPRTVAEFVRGSPGVTQTGVCDALGLSPPVAHKYLERLVRASLLRKERHWRHVRYDPTERLPLPEPPADEAPFAIQRPEAPRIFPPTPVSVLG
ncbi:MAG: winged helix-turn-helix transcriptional regulator [Methanobacteriota archaeon]